MDLDFLATLSKPASARILLLVMDGLGGAPDRPGGPTELEAASTPNLDELARQGICGLQQPVGTGITPGSGPAHLGLFGYDPIKHQVGRGVLSALGVGFDLHDQDVAVRGNFCTVDDNGIVTDRRAGRISTGTNIELCKKLREIELPDTEVFLETEKDYRVCVILRGPGLSGDVTDTDPQNTGLAPLDPRPRSPKAQATTEIVQSFLDQAAEILQDQHPANMLLLRGFAKPPHWPTFRKVFGVNAAAIAGYPMYRGLGRLIGMDVLDTGETLDEEIETLEQHWDAYDFFYLHVKKTDSSGEDGNFEQKVSVIEDADGYLPRIMRLEPDVVLVTGDHSTPATLLSHSWHPVPTMLWSKHCRPDAVQTFGERSCIAGALGPRIPSTELMPLVMANAMRLEKFGA